MSSIIFSASKYSNNLILPIRSGQRRDELGAVWDNTQSDSSTLPDILVIFNRTVHNLAGPSNLGHCRVPFSQKTNLQVEFFSATTQRCPGQRWVRTIFFSDESNFHCEKLTIRQTQTVKYILNINFYWWKTKGTQ